MSGAGSGPTSSLTVEREGVRHRDLGVNYAFHSAQMTAPAQELTGVSARCGRGGPMPFVSTVTGQVIDGRS